MANSVNRNEQKTLILPPVRGMNTTDPPHRLPEGMGIDLYNVEIDEVLGIDKRNGFTPFNTASTLIPRYSAASVKEITGAMVYFSGTALTASWCAASDVFFVKGNSSAVFWTIAGLVGTATLSLNAAYTQTVTASSYIIGPKEVGSIYRYKYGTTQKLLAFAGSDLFSATNGTTGSFTNVPAGLTDYARVNGTSFQDNFYFCNGYEFKYYDGTNITAMTGSPSPSNPKYIGVYTIGNANWLAIAGSTTDAHKSRFSFSDVNAPTTWPAANTYLAGDRDGTTITGMKPIPGGWAIFKENSIFVFSGIPGSGSLRKVVDDVGCVAPGTLVSSEGIIYFVGKRGGKLGLFSFNGSPNVTCLSDSIESDLNALKLSVLDDLVGEIYDSKYCLSGTTSSGNQNNRHFICYIYRPFSEGGKLYYPWAYGNRGMNWILNNDISGTNYLFSASPTNGIVYREDTGTSDDTTDNLSGISAAINAYADSAWYDFGDNSRRKELLRAYIDATDSGDWNLVFSIYRDFVTGGNSYNVNLGSNTLTWAEVQYGITAWQTAVDKNVTELVFNYPNFAKFFKFRWANANAAEYFSVYPCTMYYKWENR